MAAGVERLREPSTDGKAARDALLAAIRLKDTEFNAQGIELNQRYVSGAVIPDTDAKPEEFLRDPVLHVQPTTRPGAKLPHTWLVGQDGRRISTLDVVGKGLFTVLTGLSGQLWAEAADELKLPFL